MTWLEVGKRKAGAGTALCGGGEGRIAAASESSRLGSSSCCYDFGHVGVVSDDYSVLVVRTDEKSLRS